jgi:NADH dehydrogenase FAD-containing subunit
MKTIKFDNVENRTDYLSVDKSKAISAHGEIFTVGDLVKHDDKEAGTATIQSFAFDYESNDVIANTEKGSARICFITKVKQENI